MLIMDEGPSQVRTGPSGIRRVPRFKHPLGGSWVLVVGPDTAAAARLRGRLADFEVAAVELIEDPEDAVDRAATARPDAILALPGVGADLRRRLDPLGLELGPPVIAMDEIASLPAGPAGDQAVLERLANVIERHKLRARVRDLEEVVASEAATRIREYEDVRLDALRRLGLAAEYRDDNTYEHTQRVAALSARLGARLFLADRKVELIRQGAPLHDIGKIAIPDSILLKPDRLTEEEFEVIKTHAAVGASILSEGRSDLLETAERIAGSHHERFDGSGYPDGLAGQDIPIEGRLVAVADVFDILVHERPYKEEWAVEDAAAEIAKNAGTQFDPDVVQAFEDLGPLVWQALAREI